MLTFVSLALAMNSPEEGPWQTFACIDSNGVCQAGAFLGEGWATDPGAGAAWAEFGERTANTSFVTTTQPWYVLVPTSPGSLTCPNGSGNCQKVAVTTTSTHRPKATFGDAASGTASYLEWHPNGKYEVTAYILNTGAKYTGRYYVSGSGETRSERLCTPIGFKWPGRSDSESDSAVTWRIKWTDNSAPPAGCPVGWKTWDFTVDLTP